MTIETPLWMQGGTYAARLDRLILAQLYDEGVMNLGALKVTQRALGANFTVDVAIGEAVITGDDQALQGNYMARVTVFENATITAAPGTNSRYDIVCLRMNDPNAGGNAGNTGTIVVTAGTVAAVPTVPATPASSLLLAVIGPISIGTASITNAIIADSRVVAGRREVPGTIQVRADSIQPNGWLWAFGQAVSRTTYANLFAHIATTYGVGDGSTTFNLPDYRGRVPVALDNMGGTDAGRLVALANTLGLTAGEEFHTNLTAELPVHSHTITDAGHNHTQNSHVHTIDAHTHVQDAHQHAAGASTNFITQLTTGTGGLTNTTTGRTLIEQLNTATAVATNQATTATMQAATAINVATTTGITINNTGSATPANNMPPYILQNVVIRT